jgi:2-polyprenyl-3-methyl-5-hydroxy-6-metoxy-1,4-benzoquinol methylase
MTREDYHAKVFRTYLHSGFGEVHSLSARERALYCRFFRKNYAPHLPARRDARILDVGCGAGHFLHYLRSEGYTDAAGIDTSPECIALCAEQGLNPQQADAFEYLKENPGRFDAIVCNEVFEHLPKERGDELAGLCLNALCNGGVMMIKVPNAACPVVGTRSRYCDITHETGFTSHSLKMLLTVAGFRDVRVVAPDIYVTSNPVANIAGRCLFGVVTAVFRLLYRLYGVRTTPVMTKSLLAVARPGARMREDGA